SRPCYARSTSRRSPWTATQPAPSVLLPVARAARPSARPAADRALQPWRDGGGRAVGAAGMQRDPRRGQRTPRVRLRPTSTLLTTREAVRRLLELVLRLVPERGPAQRLLDQVVHAVDLHARHPGPVGDVVVDRLGERVRLLEDHADVGADGDGVDSLRVDVLP